MVFVTKTKSPMASRLSHSPQRKGAAFISIMPYSKLSLLYFSKTSCAGRRHNMTPLPCDLDLLTLKLVSESRVTWATSVPILVFLCLSVLDLGPMYATDRQTSDSIIA